MSVKISRASALRETEAGATAFRDDKERDVCPHAADGDVAEQFARHHWLKGYELAAEA